MRSSQRFHVSERTRAPSPCVSPRSGSCLCAAALSGDLPLAMDLLLGQLDEQSPDGQVPVFFDDMRGLTQTVVPPAQGWALEQLMRRHDLKKELPRETLEALYAGLSKWSRWYDAFRDGGDGL